LLRKGLTRTSKQSIQFQQGKCSPRHYSNGATADFGKLTDVEQKIYMLIARAYVAQFWPKHQYDKLMYLSKLQKHRFGVRSNVTTLAGGNAL